MSANVCNFNIPFCDLLISCVFSNIFPFDLKAI